MKLNNNTNMTINNDTIDGWNEVERKAREFEGRLWPTQNRFMVSFRSHHKTITGSVCSQNQRRFYLAETAEQAKTEALKELSVWDAAYHWFDGLSVYCVSDAAPITLGYCRFGRDLRNHP